MAKGIKMTENKAVRVWLFNSRNQVLMGKRLSKQGFGMFSVPGGKPDENESLIDAAVRETWEETGIHITPRMLEFVADTHDYANGLHYVNAHYRVNGINVMPSVIEPDTLPEDIKKEQCQLSAKGQAVDTALYHYKNVLAGYTHWYWAEIGFSKIYKKYY